MVVITLPAYDEEFTLPPLLHSIREAMQENRIDYRVVVVDDGSSDGTAKVAEDMRSKMPLTLIRHDQNRGLGESIRTGLVHSLEEAADRDIIVTMDADNTHTPGLIARMVRGIREGNDVVIASRYRPGAHVRGLSFYRRVLSRCGSIAFQLIFPTPNVRDFTSGYRAYRVAVLRRAFSAYGESFIGQSGFSCMVDVLLKLRELDAIMGEVPLILRYDLKVGPSKMLVLRTIRDTLQLMARRRLGIGGT